MITQILKSLVITGLVSAAFAFFLTHFEINFWKSFILSIVVQVTLWNFYRHITTNRFILDQRKLDNDMMAELSKQAVAIPCAYCDVENVVPIRLDTTNEFECESCNKKNAVYLNLESTQITSPLTIKDTLNINEGR